MGDLLPASVEKELPEIAQFLGLTVEGVKRLYAISAAMQRAKLEGRLCPTLAEMKRLPLPFDDKTFDKANWADINEWVRLLDRLLEYHKAKVAQGEAAMAARMKAITDEEGGQ